MDGLEGLLKLELKINRLATALVLDPVGVNILPSCCCVEISGTCGVESLLHMISVFWGHWISPCRPETFKIHTDVLNVNLYVDGVSWL